MNIVTIAPSHAKHKGPPKQLLGRDCGPNGCEIDWLASTRHESDLDVVGFTQFAMAQGWGDGLPLVPPTEARVRTFLAANRRRPEEVVAHLPPTRAACTVEKIVINAVMAGALPESLPLLIASVEAVADPDFELFGVNATTAPVAPALFINGPIRDQLGIPYSHGCFGGAASAAPAIGRALRLIMRNVAGQVVGITSQSTFGTPTRVAGMVVGEWEERSPWAPLAERRGVSGNAVTAFGGMGTMNVLDTTSQKPSEFLEMIGKSIAYPGTNCFSPSMPYGEVLVAINPIWAGLFAQEMPEIEDLQEALWHQASVDADWLGRRHRDQLEAQGRVRPNGRIYLTPEPKDIILIVCGGTGGLHATAVHSFGSSLTQTRAIV